MKSLILQVLVSSLIILTFNGCFCTKCKDPKPDIQIRDNMISVTKPIADVQDPPIYIPYTARYFILNDKDYYLVPIKDGEVLKSNWKRYKIWAVTNYNILKDLNDNNATTTILKPKEK